MNFGSVKIVPAAALLAALTAAGHAAADDFAGGYVGGDVGLHRSATSGTFTTPSSTAPTYGVDGGYGWNLGNTVLLGVEGHVDANKDTTQAPLGQYGSRSYGLGLKVGVPIDSLMPYARLGYDRTQGTGALSGFNANTPNGSLGLMYKFSPSWSMEGEWSSSVPSSSGLKLKTNTFSFGLNFHFGQSAGSASHNGRK